MPLHRLQEDGLHSMHELLCRVMKHLDLALNFELVPSIESFGCLWIADINALFGARLHNELRNVVLFVEQKLRRRVGNDGVYR